MAKNLLVASKLTNALLNKNSKPKKYNDGEGLYLIVFKSGLKSWRYNFIFGKIPWLKEELGELTKKQQSLVTTLEVIRLENYLFH